MTMQLLQGKGRTGVVNFWWFSCSIILKYDDTDFSLEIALVTRVMAMKAKGSANYDPPCILLISVCGPVNCMCWWQCCIKCWEWCL